MAPAEQAAANECVALLHSLLLQEGPRGGQEVPQGVRGGAQRSVVHRLPLEKGLPALPGLEVAEAMARESVRDVDGRMRYNKRLLSKREYKSGPESHQLFYMCVFFTFNLFLFFPKGMLLDFSVSLYLDPEN